MTVFGFHTGPDGVNDGIVANYLKYLDDRGKPFVFKATDAMPLDGQLIAEESTVPHTVIYRRSVGMLGQHAYDTPNYRISPSDAAEAHFLRHLTELPPELNKEITIVEFTNEIAQHFDFAPDEDPDIPVEWGRTTGTAPDGGVRIYNGEWMAQFGYTLAELCLLNGYRTALFGWSPGEPEFNVWEGVKMRQLLNKLAAHPHQLSLSLHEYSLSVDDILNGYPYHIGRVFQVLNMAPPGLVVDITEWGWTYNAIPQTAEAMEDIEKVFDLYVQVPGIRSAAIWALNSGWGGIGQHVNRLIHPVGEWMAQQTLPEPPPPPGNGGYKSIVLKMPQEIQEGETLKAVKYIEPFRRTLTYSHHNALVMLLNGNNESYAEVYKPNLPSQQQFIGLLNQAGINWVEVNLEDVGEPEPPPPPPGQGNALMGLHMRADPGDIPDEEVVQFQTLQPGVVKILSAHSGQAINGVKNVVPNALWIIRAFLSFGGRNISPGQFIQDTKDDVERALDNLQGQGAVLEVHNEPNLTDEGLGASWNNGAEFGQWFDEVATFYRNTYGLPIMFPGLSPGDALPGRRYHYQQFADECSAQINRSEFLGVHCYWQSRPGTPYPMPYALAQLDWFIGRFKNKPIFITEVSNNDSIASPDAKAAQYVQFWRQCKARPVVQGLTYFIASASNPAWGWEVYTRPDGSQARGTGETWLPVNMAQRVKEQMP